MNKIIVNCETNEIIEIPLTSEEIAELEAKENAVQAEQEALAAELAAKETARQAVLDKLGLTADEIAALLG